MSDTTQVCLITGFLGSGKTTFLNRIIDRFPKDKKLTLLINEFGEIGVDGTLVEGDEIDMMEISKGSIFCVCVKTDFIKGLYELNKVIQPDVLIIESTGVANPSDLKRDLKLPIFNNRFQFAEQFCIIDAAHFLDAYEVYVSLEKQIASSTVFIINKTDLAQPGTVEEIKKIVRQFHPDPLFFETTYSDIPLKEFIITEKQAVLDKTALKSPELSENELDEYIDELMENPDLEITPPDMLVSAACKWTGDNIGQVKAMAENLPSSVVRAKGFLEEKNKIYLFNYVMGDWTIAESEIPKDRIKHKNTIIFIGPPESIEQIEKISETGAWSSLGVFSHFSSRIPDYCKTTFQIV
ncbi:MAG: hypothetical protein GY795_21345 [Desulfobacterales bacterium]|nr:hypothetical protein [Desulfobacterales bacterium]